MSTRINKPNFFINLHIQGVFYRVRKSLFRYVSFQTHAHTSVTEFRKYLRTMTNTSNICKLPVSLFAILLHNLTRGFIRKGSTKKKNLYSIQLNLLCSNHFSRAGYHCQRRMRMELDSRLRYTRINRLRRTKSGTNERKHLET